MDPLAPACRWHTRSAMNRRASVRPDRPAEGAGAARRRRHRVTTRRTWLQRSAGLARRIGLRGGRRTVLHRQHRRMPGLQGAGGRRDGRASPARATTTASRRTPSRWPSTTSSPWAPRRWWCRPTGPPAASEWFGDAARAQAAGQPAGSSACEACGVAWGGGETPALAGIVEAGRIDLAASCTGLINPKQRLSLGDRLARGRRHRAARIERHPRQRPEPGAQAGRAPAAGLPDTGDARARATAKRCSPRRRCIRR